jgi:hypothetical protein
LIAIFALVLFRRPAPRASLEHALLIASALVTVGTAAAFNVNGDAFNEYKLMFCAALLLAPFSALAVDRMRPSRVPPAPALVLVGLLLAPMVLMANPRFGLERIAGTPTAIERGVSMRLTAGDDAAAWTDAIRDRTPPQTVVVLSSSRVFVPAFTARSLFAPVTRVNFPGYWLESRAHMTDLRGYSRELVSARLAVVEQLFTAGNDAAVENALMDLSRLGRPIAIVASRSRDATLLQWLSSRSVCGLLHEDKAGFLVRFCPHDQLPIFRGR